MDDRDVDHRDLPVFVYGTLRRGGRNEVVAGDRVRRRLAATHDGAVLHAGPWYPWIRDGDGTVMGELLVPVPRSNIEDGEAGDLRHALAGDHATSSTATATA